MDRQCSSCGGFCKKSGCERENVQPEPEPVAWCIVENGRVHGLVKTKPAVMNAEKWQPLYTAPPKKDEPVIDKSMAKRIATQLGWEPKREWIGLTNEEKKAICQEAANEDWTDLDVINATEAKLKDKT